jgi:hypothetical protein
MVDVLVRFDLEECSNLVPPKIPDSINGTRMHPSGSPARTLAYLARTVKVKYWLYGCLYVFPWGNPPKPPFVPQS